MTESGSLLRDNNEKIVKLMTLLKEQRDEMDYLIEKQEEEKIRLQTEIERLSFKLSLLLKSLSQRVQAKTNYDKTITEIEAQYLILVQESGKLLHSLTNEVHQLEEIMDKKTDTGMVNQAENSETKVVQNAKKETSKTSAQGRIRSGNDIAPKKQPSKTEGVPKKREESAEKNLTKPEVVKSATNQRSQNKISNGNEPNERKSSKQSNHKEQTPEMATENPAPKKVSSDANAAYENLAPKKISSDYNAKPIPPIKPHDKSSDVQLQNFKQAYERQHTAGAKEPTSNSSSRHSSVDRK